MFVVEIWDESSVVREWVSEKKVEEKVERERESVCRDVRVECREEMEERRE